VAPTGREFAAYGTSHWVVLVLTVLGAAAFVALGRRTATWWVGRPLAVLIVLLNLVMQAWVFDPDDVARTLPLQLSDLAPYAAGYALWTRSWRAGHLTYYWGLTLSSQALLTPVLRGPDFPGVEFVAFFAIHVLVFWAATHLAWGLRMRPGWPGYRFAVTATVCWAAAMLVVNSYAGTNYGFLSAKPDTPSLLDLLGPWPWYLLPETALVLGVWALMTLLPGMRPATRRSLDQ
jgi:hypothetical integral membrane protein (TIGR02206 family)